MRDAVDGYRLGVGAITAGLGAFLLLRLLALPPHEDETLVFFVTNTSFGDMLGTVLGERRGAPLHYLLAYLATLADPGLASLRLVSVAFAVASMPLVAALVSRLSDRRTALVATLLAAASWITLYHAIYARMYSLFLFTAVLSLLLLLRALERGTRGRWAAWAAATLALVAAQPYGVLVLGAEVVYVGLVRLRRPLPLRRPLVAVAAVLVLAAPLWRTYSLLASRFDVGLGEGGSELGSPLDVLRYLGEAFGDFTAGRLVAGIPAALLALLGIAVLARRRPETAILTGVVAGVPVVALLAAGSGPGVSLESRHLIFLLPFVTMAVAAGILRVGSAAGRAGPGVVAALLGFLLASQVVWGLDRTRWLYTGEPAARAEGREDAAAWLAARSRADDVLFGYEPTYLDAWEEGAPYGAIFIPRADARLALDELEDAGTPLGHGVWVLDASDYVDQEHARLTIDDASPGPEFETAVFGPFLLVRTVEPVLTPEAYLEATLRVQELSARLAVGDAGRNALTAQQALDELRGGGR
ncbi:MAG TPA: glycosyltransferase family 39 protein [Gaiellaceae bacterium]|nr:glycosyltransferase family 39 protein [Gaiellaceae bacterium]